MKERRTSSEPVWKGMLEPTFDSDGVQASSGLNEKGQEVPDPVATAPPVGYSPPSDLEDMIMRVVRNRELMAALAREGAESFEDADDFDVDEDYDPRFETTIYEEYFEAKSRRAQEAAKAAGARGAGGGGDLATTPARPTSEAENRSEPIVKRSESDEPSDSGSPSGDPPGGNSGGGKGSGKGAKSASAG